MSVLKKKIRLKDFMLPAYYLGMILCVSSFGQTFLDIGLSVFASAYFLILFLMKARRLTTPIRTMFVLLIVYAAVCCIAGGANDYLLCFIAVFTIASFTAFVHVDMDDTSFVWNVFIYSAICLGLLIAYDAGIAFSNWNANSISGLTVYGVLGFIILLKYGRSKWRRGIIVLILVYFCLKLLLTDSRNGFLVLIVAFCTIVLFERFMMKKWAFRIYYTVSLFVSMLIAKTSSLFTDALRFSWIQRVSVELFEKRTLLSSRDVFWQQCEYLIGDKWLFGTGESLYHYIYSHNMYYSVVYMFGIVGYLFFIGLNVAVLETIRKYAAGDKVAVLCTLAYLANMWGQIAENRLFTSDLSTFFPYLLLSIALNRALQNKKQNPLVNKEDAV